jgi:hypothetical protein
VRVELVPVLVESGRGRWVVVRAKGDDEDVGVVGPAVCGYLAMGRIDREDRFLGELQGWLPDACIAMPNIRDLFSAEHHVELGESEHERVALIDQRYTNLLGHRL